MRTLDQPSVFARTVAALLAHNGWEELGVCRWRHPPTGCEAAAGGATLTLSRGGRSIAPAFTSGREGHERKAYHVVERLLAHVRRLEAGRQVAADAD